MAKSSNSLVLSATMVLRVRYSWMVDCSDRMHGSACDHTRIST